jgi:hypothetical protein
LDITILWWVDISSLFWFLFSWWLMILSISVHLFGHLHIFFWEIYVHIFEHFNRIMICFWCWLSEFLICYDMSPLTDE